MLKRHRLKRDMFKKLLIMSFALLAFVAGMALSQWFEQQKVDNKNSAWHHQFDSNVANINTLNDINSRLIVIDFWSSWCKPCVKSLPYYLDFFKQFDEKEITFITINLDVDKQQALDFITKYQLEALNVFYDTNGQGQKLFSISGLPALFIYDQQRLVHTKLGFKEQDKPEFEALIQKHLLSNKPS